MFTLTPASSEDEDFLSSLYQAVRSEEFQGLGWNEPELRSFLLMQYDMQKRSYAMQYPQALQEIICVRGVSAGRLITMTSEACISLIDIALLPEYQGQGIGTGVVERLKQKAGEQGKPVRLHALEHQPAQRLYERLGFRVTAQRPPHVAMEWRPY